MAMGTVRQPSGGNGSLGDEAAQGPGAALNSHTAGFGHAIEGQWLELPAPGPIAEKAVSALTLRVNRMARESVGLTQRAEELESELEQRNRRLQQLMGERDELRSLLARRDSELTRLNQEIGALGARAEPAPGGSSALFAAARRLLDKFQHARTASGHPKPAASPPEQVAVRAKQRRLVPWIKDRAPKDIFAVVLFGLSEAEIERVLEVVERYCAEHELAPLLLADNDSFELFRGRRVLFEFLPARSNQERFAPELDWRLYTLRRLALIRRKWQPMRVIAFGHRAAEVVQLWHDSPFEETPIPASPNGSSASAKLAWRPVQLSAAVQP